MNVETHRVVYIWMAHLATIVQQGGHGFWFPEKRNYLIDQMGTPRAYMKRGSISIVEQTHRP